MFGRAVHHLQREEELTGHTKITNASRWCRVSCGSWASPLGDDINAEPLCEGEWRGRGEKEREREKESAHVHTGACVSVCVLPPDIERSHTWIGNRELAWISGGVKHELTHSRLVAIAWVDLPGFPLSLSLCALQCASYTYTYDSRRRPMNESYFTGWFTLLRGVFFCTVQPVCRKVGRRKNRRFCFKGYTKQAIFCYHHHIKY